MSTSRLSSSASWAMDLYNLHATKDCQGKKDNSYSQTILSNSTQNATPLIT